MDAKKQTLSLLSPEGKLERNRKELGFRSEAMDRAIATLLQRDEARLRSSIEQLGALHPLAILQRGYSAVRNGQGKVIGSVEELAIGQTVELMMRNGSAMAEIREVRREDRNNERP